MSYDSIGKARDCSLRALSLFALTFVLAACEGQFEMDLLTNSVPLKENQMRALISANKICSDVTVTTTEGEKLKGTRKCKSSGIICTKMGELGCIMQDPSLYGYHGPNVVPENIRQGIKFGNKKGEAKSNDPLCTEGGQKDCVVQGQMVAAERSAVPAKIPVGAALAGVAGTHNPGYPSPSDVLDTETVNGQPGLLASCKTPGQSSCVTTAALRAIAKSELQPSHIRKDIQLGGVTGTYAGAFTACTNDGQTGCILSGALRAMNPSSLRAARIRSSVTLAGVMGTMTPSPALCDGSRKTGCVTSASFPAANYSLITKGNIKNGASLPGLTAAITGEYPSSTEPFVDRNSGVKDLSSANFASSMASAQTFEYWDSTGTRHTNAGDANLVSANLSRATTIFGVTGGVKPMPAQCNDTLHENCVTNATHVSYPKGLLTEANLKKDFALTWGATITGQYPSAAHKLPGDTATADLASATFNGQVQSAVAFEYWDSKGVRQTGTGSAALVGANLVDGVTVFGVAGTAKIRPANCSDTNNLNCVTSGSHPAYSPAALDKDKIKAGVTIGLVTGTYPSAANPIAGHNAGIADLAASTFNSQLTRAGNVPFEYWDNQGRRFQGASNGHISGLHLRSGKTVFDVAGTLPIRSADCSGPNQDGCVATPTYPSYEKLALKPEILKAGVTILGVTGDYPSATNRLPGASAVADLGGGADLNSKLSSAAAFEYWDSAGVRHQSTGDADLVPGNLLDGVTAFGVAGNMIKKPNDCSAQGEQDCVTTAKFQSYDSRTLTAGVLKKGVSLGGITGDYPSAANPLRVSTAVKDLRGSTPFNSDVTTAGMVEFFNAEGSRFVKSIPLLSAPSVRQGVTLFGVAGSAESGPALCTATSITSCLTSANFPAYAQGAIDARHLKNNTKIGGVTGLYPSAASPLPGASAMADLDDATFIAKIKSNAPFEYWDAQGRRHVGQGSADIAAHNIMLNKTVFGQLGNMRNPNLPVPRDKVRLGTTIHGSSGTQKVVCNNTGRSGWTGTRNIDDYNGGGSIPSAQVFGADQSCNTGTFVDMRKNGVSCHGTSRSCIFRDTISGLQWHSIKLSTAGYHAAEITLPESKSYCQSLGSGWRVPTHKEFVMANVNGLRQLNRTSDVIFPYGSRIWTSTKTSEAENLYKVVRPKRHNHKEHTQYDTDGYPRTFCVR